VRGGGIGVVTEKDKKQICSFIVTCKMKVSYFAILPIK
jgi:hypothetical protein